MGRTRLQGTTGLLSALALLCLIFAASAQAAAPTHPRHEALDVTGLNHACGAAVDTKGDLYLSSAGDSKIKVYDSSHKLLTEIADVNTPCGLAVTTTGNLYVSEQATGEVVRFKPGAYPFSGTPTYGPREVIDNSGKAKGIAVDPFDNRLYVAEGDRVSSYGAAGNLGIDEVQQVKLFEATGGTFKLKFGGQETSPLPFNPTTAQIQAALEALSTIGAGNVSVDKGAESAFQRNYLVSFTGVLAHTDVEALGCDSSALTGSPSKGCLIEETVKSFSGRIGEGALEEATGIAAYTHRRSGGEKTYRYLWAADGNGLLSDRLELFSALNDIRALKPHREVNGAATPDGSFGFGAKGAYLAADPGNRDGEGNCKVVGEQACTAGHLFLYDAKHEALDEFDASGEYLTQVKNAAFEDAQPTAIAIERSGTSSDGTIYVTAGPGPGAGALAFGPLAAPSRAVLGEPLSHQLSGPPAAIATDANGYVYVAQGPLIRIYKPDGTEIKNGTKFLLEDKKEGKSASPGDVAVDSAGNVYVLDENGGFPGEEEVTYYTPSKYPPEPSTTYTRHEPAIVTPAKFTAKGSMEAIAINPGPGPGKDRLFVTSVAQTQEYDSAASGSTLLNKEFAAGLELGNRQSIAVNGADGDVWFGGNPKLVSEVDPTGKEILSQFENTGAADGEAGTNPYLAVEQASGHVVSFDGATSSAREYDAVGSFVAQFGNFTTGLIKDYDVAVDNSCAIQGLSGKACEEFDPSNGTAYIAWGDTSTTHPPYRGVNAFGQLAYGEAPSTVTGIASGLGGAGATLNGTVDPNGFALDECAFTYIEAALYEQNEEEAKPPFEGGTEAPCEPSAAELGSGSSPLAVKREVTLPDPEAAYRFALRAKNAFGEAQGEAAIFGAPTIEALPPLPILYTEAKLRARVNPVGLPTEYRFEYLDRESYEEQGGFEGPETRRSPWTKLAAGEKAVLVSATASGLAEGSEQRYRLVAKNEAATAFEPPQSFTTQARRATEDCANGVFRFGPSASLPDCRAYELVTPAETNGLSPAPPNPGTSPSGIFNYWLTPQRGEAAGERLSYTTGGTLPGFEGNGRSDGYLAQRGSGEHPVGGWQSTLFSPDYLQALGGPLFELGIASDQLYSAWQINSEPEPPAGTLAEGTYLRTPSGFEAMAQGSEGIDMKALARYVSAGGAHVIFASEAHLEPQAPPAGITAFYDREAGASSATVVSGPPPGASPGLEAQFESEDAQYAGASEDGSAVAFTVGGALYVHREGQTFAVGSGSFAGVSEDGRYAFLGNDESPGKLLRFDTQSEEVTEIAKAGIFALVSPDGSHAFFSSEEALTGSEENDNGEEAQAGGRNLYAWDGSQTSFVGQLAASDFKHGGFPGSVEMTLAAWTKSIGRSFGSSGMRASAPTRSTPGGDTFVFQSHARLTAYDNEGMSEVYRYAPAAKEGERLLCLSCNPSGAAPEGDAMLQELRFGSPVDLATMIANVTDDGGRAFFQSYDRLLPEDANDAEDVYEWKAKGTGGCTRPGGCLALISTGQGEENSYLFAMSADGRDVFVWTKEKLVGMDVAGSPSLYDAREGGGIPEPFVPSPCQGDDCQGNGTPPPAIPGAATTGAGEAGAPSPVTPCARGKHRVKGRCVPKRPHKHRKHRHSRRAHANRGGDR